MINKRLLVKNLLAYQSENTFFDKKRQLNLHTLEGKAKFLKHICALANSNFFNHSYIVVGVDDETNEIVGDDFFDDSTIQNLVNAYLINPPLIQYENILFHHLDIGKIVGLVTIQSIKKVCRFSKNIYT
ncbi:MAG: ATP-binding protein, partial [Flavobacterium sp.]